MPRPAAASAWASTGEVVSTAAVNASPARAAAESSICRTPCARLITMSGSCTSSAMWTFGRLANGCHAGICAHRYACPSTIERSSAGGMRVPTAKSASPRSIRP